MGHIGLTPQSATKLGGYKAQGRTRRPARRLIDDALALEAPAASRSCSRRVPATVARASRRRSTIPTIGIGAGAGTRRPGARLARPARLSEGHAPRFVKRYADLGDAIARALGRYADDVRAGAFPEEQHTYAMPEED